MKKNYKDQAKDFFKRMASQFANGHPKASQYPDFGGDENPEQQHAVRQRGFVKFGRFCLIAVAGLLIFSNIRPYVGMIQMLGAGVQDNPTVLALMQIAPLRWLLSEMGNWVVTFIGLLLWGALQAAQMLPKLVMDSPDALMRIMAWVHAYRTVPTSEKDSETMRSLKYRFNNLPAARIGQMQQWRAIAYVVDAALCFWYYPPINGGVDRLGVFLMAPSMSDIAWPNVLFALLTMFGVEIVYELYKGFSTAVGLMAPVPQGRA